MSGNSNPSINSPASTSNDLTTLVGDDAIIAANLLQEFNDRQAHHISVSSTDSSVQYVPHSPLHPSKNSCPLPRSEYASPQKGWRTTPLYPLGQLRPSSAWRTTPSRTARGP